MFHFLCLCLLPKCVHCPSEPPWTCTGSCICPHPPTPVTVLPSRALLSLSPAFLEGSASGPPSNAPITTTAVCACAPVSVRTPVPTPVPVPVLVPVPVPVLVPVCMCVRAHTEAQRCSHREPPALQNVVGQGMDSAKKRNLPFFKEGWRGKAEP